MLMKILNEQTCYLSSEALFEEQNIRENESVFVFSNLIPGMGITVGNTLRRLALLCVPGTGITAIKADGALHEFAHIDGMSCDINALIMLLKKVIISGYCETESEANLQVRGPAVVTAGMITTRSNLVILNPDCYLFDLSAGCSIHMKLTIKSGYGYNKPNNEEDFQIPGVVSVDTIFSPIVNASYSVQPDINDTETLKFTLVTNGACSPYSACMSIIRTFCSVLSKAGDIVLHDIPGENAEKETISEKAAAIVNIPIVDISPDQLSMRAKNGLNSIGAYKVGDLTSVDLGRLAILRNVGEKTMTEISNFMRDYDLHNPTLSTNNTRARKSNFLQKQEVYRYPTEPTSVLGLSEELRDPNKERSFYGPSPDYMKPMMTSKSLPVDSEDMIGDE